MDRVGNVDSVDGLEVSLDEASTGWNAYDVWRDRVHGARERAQASDAPVTGSRRDAPRHTVATGWDPLETWRGRVQRARTNRRG